MATILGFMRRYKGISRTKPRIRRYPPRYVQSRELSDTKFFGGDDATLPVLIVGAGPVGLVLSILLTKLGVKCAVLERNARFSTHPQAHFINNRSMEIFRKLDGLAEEIEKSQPSVDLWRKFVYCTSLCGPILGSVDHMQPQDFEKVVSPVSVAHFSQYKLMDLLLKRLKNLNFTVQASKDMEGLGRSALRGKEILMGHECISIDTSDQCVNATVSFFNKGKNITRNIRCNMLVGADGAGSTVRKLVGIDMRGEKDLQNLISVHFMSRDLGEYLLNERPGMLFFIFNTEAIGALVAHDLPQGEFVMQVPFYPPQQTLSDFTSETCKMLIIKLVGRELSDLDVLDIKPWIMHAEVAEKFACCDNRILLAGDAAHRFPPAGGFGMNTGIQDAHNLAWKIAALYHGIAQSPILDTYEAERRPIALFNTALSVQNFKAAMEVPAALGLDPNVANTVHRAINDVVGTILPSGVQKKILDGIFAIGRAQLSESLLSQENPLGRLRLARLKHMFEEGKSLQLQFPAEDLGFRYSQGALVPDRVIAASDPGVPTGRRRDYVPSADSGFRLPHMFVRIFTSKEVVSTLDLVPVNKIEFLLIITPLEESYHLARTAMEVADEFKAKVWACVMWPADITDNVTDSKVKLAPWQNYLDVQEITEGPFSASWCSICKMTNRGAVLVRPDEHIAWCVKDGAHCDANLEMRRAFSTILGTGLGY